MEEDIKEQCDIFRHEIKRIGDHVKALMKHPDLDVMVKQTYDGQHNEMKANIMLAYRHLEDARMRVGKILQAADDGVSILDKQEGKRKCADCDSEAVEDLIYCSKHLVEHNENDKNPK